MSRASLLQAAPGVCWTYTWRCPFCSWKRASGRQNKAGNLESLIEHAGRREVLGELPCTQGRGALFFFRNCFIESLGNAVSLPPWKVWGRARGAERAGRRVAEQTRGGLHGCYRRLASCLHSFLFFRLLTPKSELTCKGPQIEDCPFSGICVHVFGAQLGLSWVLWTSLDYYRVNYFT